MKSPLGEPFLAPARAQKSEKDGIMASLLNLVSFLCVGEGIPEEDTINKVITG